MAETFTLRPLSPEPTPTPQPLEAEPTETFTVHPSRTTSTGQPIEEPGLEAPGIESEPTSQRMSMQEQLKIIGKGLMQLPGVILDPEIWGSGFGIGMMGKMAKKGIPSVAATEKVAAEKVPEVAVEAEAKTVEKGVESFQVKPPGGVLPTTPMREGELPKYAGSVNLERIKTDDDVKFAIKEASDVIAKREPVPLEQIESEATKAGFTIEDAEKFARQTTEQRAKFLATRNVGTALAERYETARAAYADAQTPENFAALKEAQAGHLRGFRATQEAASNAGLALRTYGMASKADVKTQMDKAINQAMAILQSKGKLSDELTARLASIDPTDQEGMAAFLRTLQTKTAPYSDKLFEAYLNSILSGPQTHAANIVGNLSMSMLRPFDRIGAAAVDILRAGATGTSRERFFGEAGADFLGMVTALPDAARAWVHSARTGLVTHGTKLEIPRGASIEGVKGEVARVPTKVLQATDEFFKVLSRSGSQRVAAYRGLGKGETEALKETEALQATFQQELGKTGQAAMHLRDAAPGLRYVIPFIKTPINIGKEGLKRTPLGVVDLVNDAVRGRLANSGALSEQVSKTLVGSGLSAWIATEVASGHITGGGPSDPDQRGHLLDTGWRPYSIKVGDTYYPYNRIEPLATWMGTVADATELMDLATEAEQTEVVQKLAQGAAKNITDKSFLQGISDMSDALHDPGRYGEKFLSARLAGVVPSLVAQAARAQDPEMREVKGILDAIRSRTPKIPGVTEGRQGLNPKRNIYGEPIEEAGGFWARYLSPSVGSEEKGTPGQIAIVESGADIAKLSPTLTIANQKIKLDPDQYDRYQEVAGRFVKAAVESYATAPGWGKLTKEQQADLLHQAVEDGRKIGRAAYIAELKPTLKRK